MSGVSTDTAAPPVVPSEPAGPPQRRWTPWIILAGILVAGGVVAGVLLSGGSGNSTANAQLAEVEQACTQWAASGADQPAPPSDWCTNMRGWMSDRMDNYSGMWASPTAMRATCQQWGAAASPSDSGNEANRAQWCDDMVSWMQQHAAQWGSWNGWMMHGPMMG